MYARPAGQLEIIRPAAGGGGSSSLSGIAEIQLFDTLSVNVLFFVHLSVLEVVLRWFPCTAASLSE